jgi:XTP/dITP diphosphohydrolase
MELIFATNNQNKVDEVQSIVPSSIKIITLKEAGIDIDIPEPHFTLEENAAEKGRTIFSYTGKNCFGEDTGLEVTTLNGEPGVYSARYASNEPFDKLRASEKNMEKLLYNLKPHEDRSAQFRTVIFLIFDNKEYFFEGICKGTIGFEPVGNKGFGYDPLFIPTGSSKTFAQMTLEEKNKHSHRRKAMDKLVTFLNQLNLNR